MTILQQTTAARELVGGSTPINDEGVAALRDYLAEERTFLAWIRTGIALMGLGVLVAHFGILGEDLHTTGDSPLVSLRELSVWVGTALIAIGVGVNLLSARNHIRLVEDMNRGCVVQGTFSGQGVIVSVLLALVGIAITIYMIAVGP